VYQYFQSFRAIKLIALFLLRAICVPNFKMQFIIVSETTLFETTNSYMESNPYEKLILKTEGKLNAEESVRLLKQAFENKDADLVEEAIYSCSESEGFSNKFSEIFCKLLQTGWHNKHEDIARILQGIKDPSTVDCLYNAAELEFDYLDYDDTYQFARKCIWALADIGTSEAKAKLQQLAHSNNKFVAEYAQKRLNRWEEERFRKGASE
jgi:hypothetical protein